MDFKMQVAFALTERPDRVADTVDDPEALHETSPLVETDETGDPEFQIALAVTSCDVPSA